MVSGSAVVVLCAGGSVAGFLSLPWVAVVPWVARLVVVVCVVTRVRRSVVDSVVRARVVVTVVGRARVVVVCVVVRVVGAIVVV